MNLDPHEKSENPSFEGSKFREEVFSKAVRAGKRTYFFDVKATRKNEYYLTITESKKRSDNSGNLFFEKHKIFLYKEDFEKFSEGLADILSYIRENQPALDPNDDNDGSSYEEFSNIDFDDLNH
ncbi:MAG TPA: DUF3276 family protein [Prolixibacteraceae bacterium]|nr:DUF3276 family protein [Prolixibacteraceae bacterium]